ncbi:hypothetical protein [Bradyrhizobium arachidis]|uniref:hypothetical protein n=1 Tax=Bradyrhizobium arachidis TaxID=858423 RepID=UPI0011607A7C|nr:hypothetical protein [Bradyrhizobium arachidis]
MSRREIALVIALSPVAMRQPIHSLKLEPSLTVRFTRIHHREIGQVNWRDDGWQEYRPLQFWRKIRFTDGTEGTCELPVLRRRRPDGRWEYRRLAAEERERWERDQAW